MASVILIISSICGVLPVGLWLIFFLWQDIKKPEPKKWILILFLLGMAITPLVYFLEGGYLKIIGASNKENLSIIQTVFVYLGVAVIEELAKFLTTTLILKKNKYFDEAIDAMIYLIVLALGFSVVENILVVYQEIKANGYLLSALSVLSLRFIGANLLHALSSGIIGYFWALKLLTKKSKYLYLGFILGMTLHWLFNLAIILIGGDRIINLSFGLFLSAVFLLWAFDLLKQIEKPIKYND
ncbi:MAG: PrsW family intramembrane metalloprotease [Minisyncoccia bacterium]